MSQHATVSPATDVSVESLLERIQNLSGMIEAASPQIEKDRRLPPELLAAMHDAKLFRLLLPQAYGGLEFGPPDFFQITSALARFDASTAWCIGQANGCSMSAAYLDPAVANEIWGQDPHAVLAWGPGKGKAVVEGDGYRVTGNWAFASGMRHATWLGGHSHVFEADGSPRLDENGKPVQRTMLFPAASTKITDIWNVMGLRGTASDAFAVTDLFVAADHAVSRDTPSERQCHGPLYNFMTSNLYATGFSGVAQGIARSMHDSFMNLAADKAPRNMPHVLRDNEVVQAEVAIGDARLQAARALVLKETTEIWDEVCAGSPLTDDHRARIRLAATYGIHEAKAVADTAYDAAGATAIFNDNDFERRFRDLHTVTQQMQGRRDHFRSVGAFMLGHPLALSSG
jgi:alkylation response protein AidB-like acyl-CoA dehydrogenase